MRYTLLGLLVTLSLSVSAQDKIYKRDGDTVLAKIKEVGATTISFKRFDNPEGPEYTLSKTDVEKIRYQNGTEDVFEEREERFFPPMPGMLRPPRIHSNSKVKYSDNILAVAPLQFTENGIGASISYERNLEKNGIISFYIPAVLTFNVNRNNTYVSNGAYVTGTNSDPMFYLMPGVKIYPTGNKGKVKYAIGPNLVIASGKQTEYYDPYNSGSGGLQKPHFVFGAMVTNYLNINPTAHLYLGLELGLGSTYVNKVDGVNQNSDALAEFAFKIGYRF